MASKSLLNSRCSLVRDRRNAYYPVRMDSTLRKYLCHLMCKLHPHLHGKRCACARIVAYPCACARGETPSENSKKNNIIGNQEFTHTMSYEHIDRVLHRIEVMRRGCHQVVVLPVGTIITDGSSKFKMDTNDVNTLTL